MPRTSPAGGTPTGAVASERAALPRAIAPDIGARSMPVLQPIGVRLRMSAYRGRPEVIGGGSKRRFLTLSGSLVDILPRPCAYLGLPSAPVIMPNETRDKRLP